jgi:hypothetical protein
MVVEAEQQMALAELAVQQEIVQELYFQEVQDQAVVIAAMLQQQDVLLQVVVPEQVAQLQLSPELRSLHRAEPAELALHQHWSL